MKWPAPASPNPSFSDKQRAALISLLGDDDPAVYGAARERLVSFGSGVSEWLRPHLASAEPALRRRAREIVQMFARQESDTSFLALCLTQGEEFDLEHAVWLMAKTRYPDINVDGYSAILDSHASDLRERLDPSGPATRILATCNDFLFSFLGFRGNEEDHSDPEDFYLNRVLDRRKGNSITLSLVYLFLARRLRLPMTGIGLPGHFLARYQSPVAECYVDAFHQGKLLAKSDCVKFLASAGHTIQEGYLTPVSSRRVLLRICAGLRQAFGERGDATEGSRVQRYLVALAK